jgi:hypothetical protein
LPDFHASALSARDQQKYTVTALVDVWELTNTGAGGAMYQYTVVYRVTSFQDYGNASISSAEWQIEDVVRTQ